MSDSGELHLGGGASRLRHGLVLAGVLALAGLLFLLFGEGVVEGPSQIALALFALAGVMAVFAYRQFKAPSPLRMEETGLWFAEWNQTIPWRAVEDCYIGGSRLRPLLILKLADPKAFLRGLGEKERQALQRSPHVRLPELRIPASAAGESLLPLRNHILQKLRKGPS